MIESLKVIDIKAKRQLVLDPNYPNTTSFLAQHSDRIKQRGYRDEKGRPPNKQIKAQNCSRSVGLVKWQAYNGINY